MKFFAVAAFFATAAVAVPSASVHSIEADTCSSHAMCCKQQTASGSEHLTEHEKAGLLDVLGSVDLGGLLGHKGTGRYSDCESLVQLGGKCDTNTVCCPTGSQTGLVNIGCVGLPIKLL